MATNLFNKAHKATSDNYRKGYDRIKWDKQSRQEQESDKDEYAE